MRQSRTLPTAAATWRAIALNPKRQAPDGHRAQQQQRRQQRKQAAALGSGHRQKHAAAAGRGGGPPLTLQLGVVVQLQPCEAVQRGQVLGDCAAEVVLQRHGVRGCGGVWRGGVGRGGTGSSRCVWEGRGVRAAEPRERQQAGENGREGRGNERTRGALTWLRSSTASLPAEPKLGGSSPSSALPPARSEYSADACSNRQGGTAPEAPEERTSSNSSVCVWGRVGGWVRVAGGWACGAGWLAGRLGGGAHARTHARW